MHTVLSLFSLSHSLTVFVFSLDGCETEYEIVSALELALFEGFMSSIINQRANKTSCILGKLEAPVRSLLPLYDL